MNSNFKLITLVISLSFIFVGCPEKDANNEIPICVEKMIAEKQEKSKAS